MITLSVILVLFNILLTSFLIKEVRGISNETPKPSDPPNARMVPIQEGSEMIKNYVQTRLNGNPRADAITGWWPAKDLNQYISFAERKSKELKIEVTGYKYFIGAYPGNIEEDSLNVSGYQTILILPTTHYKTDKPNHLGHRAFVPELSSTENPHYFDLAPLFEQNDDVQALQLMAMQSFTGGEGASSP